MLTFAFYSFSFKKKLEQHWLFYVVNIIHDLLNGSRWNLYTYAYIYCTKIERNSSSETGPKFLLHHSLSALFPLSRKITLNSNPWIFLWRIFNDIIVHSSFFFYCADKEKLFSSNYVWQVLQNDHEKMK